MTEDQSRILIRKAALDDIDVLCTMIMDLFMIEDDFSPDINKQRVGLDMLINGGPCSVMLIAEVKSEIAGMVNLQRIISTAAGGYSVLLEDLYVKPEFRKKGMGRMLIDHAVQWGKQCGALRVQLAADIRNKPAISFYLKESFNASNMVLHYKGL